MLTQRQKLTIQHLAIAGIKTPEEIIAYCQQTLQRARHPLNKPRRRKSRKYYKGIIGFYKKFL